MTQPAKANEPSMEEILASIRRIIADDDIGKSAQPAAEAPKEAVKAAEIPKAGSASAPPMRPASPPPLPAAGSARVAPSEPPPVEATPAPGTMNDREVDEQSADIRDLTEAMAAPMPSPRAASAAAAHFRTIDGDSDVSFEEPAEQPAPQANSNPQARLLSRATSAAVDSAFNSLAQTVLVQNARTLEDLVREMLRPMLKSWLDDNLPGIVERLVRAEIERVSRGR
jgi:uncharacterized protein